MSYALLFLRISSVAENYELLMLIRAATKFLCFANRVPLSFSMPFNQNVRARLDLIVIENERRVVNRRQRNAEATGGREEWFIMFPWLDATDTRREHTELRARGTKWKNNLQKWNSVGGRRWRASVAVRTCARPLKYIRRGIIVIRCMACLTNEILRSK